MEFIEQFLPWLYGVLAIVVIWFVVELIITIRRSRVVIDDLQKSVESAATTINTISAELEPAIKKADPLMDRLSLSVDAVNLELLRLDEVMDDVKTMTSSAASATKSINSVASAPADLVNSVANKVRHRFGSKNVSKETIKIGEERSGANEEAINNLVSAVEEAVDEAVDDVEETQED